MTDCKEELPDPFDIKLPATNNKIRYPANIVVKVLLSAWILLIIITSLFILSVLASD